MGCQAISASPKGPCEHAGVAPKRFAESFHYSFDSLSHSQRLSVPLCCQGLADPMTTMMCISTIAFPRGVLKIYRQRMGFKSA